MKLKYLLISSMFLTSCSDSFLNLSPDSELSANSFYQTEEQFNQALSGVYRVLRSTVQESGYLMGEMRSDNTYYDYYAPDRGIHIMRRENIDDFLDDEENQWTNDYFNTCYVGISRANTILERIESVSIPEKSKNTIIGETKFLRAYFYFNLVRYFGDVPLHLKEVKKEVDAFLPRTSVEIVYQSIIDDVQDAISKLDAPTFPQNGRINKGAAMTLLADIYLTRKNFIAAEQLLVDVTKMGYSLLSDYADVFKTSNKNSRESVFEIQFMMGDQGQNSMFLYWFIPKSTNVQLITGVGSNTLNYGGFNVPTNNMIGVYEVGDLRKSASIGIAEGIIGSDGSFVIEAVKSSDGYSVPNGKIAKPFVKKYLNPHSRERNTDDNWPVYRYSNVLLMLAEALNENGKSTDALNYINLVRKRAGSTLPLITTIDKNILRNSIFDERRVELAFENHRWHDLVRSGKAVDVMTAHGVEMRAKYSYLRADSYKPTVERLIFPIPFIELKLNSLLVQNPGY